MKQRIWVAGAVAAMMIASASAVLAQDDSTQNTTTPDSTMSTPVTPAAPMAMPAPIPMPEAIDYKILLNQPFDYQDLQQAKYSGLSNRQIAVAAKIADETNEPFSTVANQILHGSTYAMLAQYYNMDLASLYNVNDEEQKISDYKQAYTTTGWYALRSMDNDDTGLASSDMSTDNSSAAGMTSTTTPVATNDIIGVAMSMRRLSTFVKAVQAAGLTSTLQGPGPFTVFAPDNAAFKRLPKGALKSLMSNPTQLMQVLEYHVIQGQAIDAAAAMSMTSPTSPATMQGGTLNVTTNNGKVMVNNATVVKADVQASNGIIHVIDQVLMPPAGATDNGTTGTDNGTTGTDNGTTGTDNGTGNSTMTPAPDAGVTTPGQ